MENQVYHPLSSHPCFGKELLLRQAGSPAEAPAVLLCGSSLEASCSVQPLSCQKGSGKRLGQWSRKGGTLERSEKHLGHLLWKHFTILTLKRKVKVKSPSRVQHCNLSSSSVHGIFQARILEWVAISFSRRSSQPRDWTLVSCIVGRLSTVWATREVLINQRVLLIPLRESWRKKFPHGAPCLQDCDEEASGIGPQRKLFCRM